MKHLDIHIKGIVQGVGFRLSTKVVADQLGVKGSIRNMADGSVFIEAEGDDFSLEQFKEWCHEGPQGARVEELSLNEGELKRYKNFDILKKAVNR